MNFMSAPPNRLARVAPGGCPVHVLDDEGRRRVVKMMWEIIYVDGDANEFENNIIWRAADLLGL